VNDPNRPILVIEDTDEDFEVTSAAMQLALVPNPLTRCRNGEEAMDYMLHRGHFIKAVEPLYILLDLNLGRVDGRQILMELRSSPWLAAVPVIVLSTSTNPRDIRLCYQLGAAGYLVKPVDLGRFERMIQGVNAYWTDVVALPEQEDSDYAATCL
jgi:CheY-like chemotaxis protein